MDDRRLPSDGPINVTTGSSPESVAHQRHDWKLARVSGPSTSRLEARPTSVAMKRRLREGAGRRLLRHVAQTMRRTAPSTLSGPVMRHVAKGIDPPTGFFVRQLSAFARSGHPWAKSGALPGATSGPKPGSRIRVLAISRFLASFFQRIRTGDDVAYFASWKMMPS